MICVDWADFSHAILLSLWSSCLSHRVKITRVHTTPSALFCSSVAVMKTLEQNQFGKQRVCYILWVSVHHWGKPRQELKPRPRRNATDWIAQVHVQLPFLLLSRVLSQGRHHPQWTELTHIKQSRKCHADMPAGWADGGNFQWRFFLLRCLSSLCQLDKIQLPNLVGICLLI